jgi:hypothetical protein
MVISGRYRVVVVQKDTLRITDGVKYEERRKPDCDLDLTDLVNVDFLLTMVKNAWKDDKIEVKRKNGMWIAEVPFWPFLLFSNTAAKTLIVALENVPDHLSRA